MTMKFSCRSEEQRYHALWSSWSAEDAPFAANSILERTARRHPHRPAIMVAPDTVYSYEQLYHAATHISHLLTRMKIGKGDRVMILYENSPLFYMAYYGAWQTGAIVIPLNVFLQEAELLHIIADAQPSLLLVSKTLEKLCAGKIASSVKIVAQDIIETVAVTDQAIPYETHYHDADEPSIVLYTSGTTGMPKGVVYSSRAIITNVFQGVARFNFTHQERALCPLPLFHSFTQLTCVWSSFICAACVIIVPKITRTNLLAALALKPTVIIGIPTLYGLLCRLKKVSLDSVRYCISGGDPLPNNIRRAVAWRFGKKLANGYGLTETGPLIAVDLTDQITTTHTVGRPIVELHCEIRDATDGIGTLWVTGPNLMLGYYNAPEATEKVMKDGWFNTGDLATFDDAGNLVLCGRERELIVNKGVKIYPQEVETVLTNHAAVALAAVIAGHDPADGDYPVAYVQLIEGATADPEALRSWCQRYLAPYKVPRQIYIVEQMPMTATGKINKKELATKLQPPA